jgi:hypothetical protein
MIIFKNCACCTESGAESNFYLELEQHQYDVYGGIFCGWQNRLPDFQSITYGIQDVEGEADSKPSQLFSYIGKK